MPKHLGRIAFLSLSTLLAGHLLNPAGSNAAAAEPRSLRVYRDKVEPHWFGENGGFWYRVTTGEGRSEFVLVEAEKGLRKPAFDHERLAKALEQAGVQDVKPENLPVESLDFDTEGRLGFRLRGNQWTCRLSDYSVEKSGAAQLNNGLALDGDAPNASRRTGEETTLTFNNRTDAEVELFWLDSEGEKRSYGKIKPGDTRAQHTFGGHVWRVTDGSGKTLGVFEAQDESAYIEVTGTVVVPPKNQPARKRERREDTRSPDARWKARFQDHNLFITEVASGSEKALTTDGNATNEYSGTLFWSPDSRKLVVLRTWKGEDRKVYMVESSPKDQVQPKLHTVDYPKPGDRVDISKPHLFDLSSGREVPVDDSLFPNPWSITEVRWSPDSSRFSFLYNQRGHQLLRVLSVDADSGKVSTLIEEKSDTFIDYSTKLVTEYIEEGGFSEVLWSSERDGWNHLYLYDCKTGALKNQVTKGPWVVRGIDWVDREKRQIWFKAGGIRPEQDPYYVHFCRVNFDGTDLTILTEGDGTHQVRFSPDRKFLVDTWSRVDLPPRTELRRSADGQRVCPLETADDTDLKNGEWRAPERFVAKGRDGETDIYGIIHWPKQFDPTRKYPVIESIYAGPQGSFVPKNFHVAYGGESLCERGFVVVQIDGMGTSDRSKKFHDVAARNLGDSGFPDRILWMKAAAARFPCLDLTRVGIYGTSAGGQSALRALLAHGDFYKAAVSDCGCHDNRVDKIWWNEQWMGYPIGEHYAEQSNVTQAHKLQGKLLLMVGELDKNVDPASTMQVVNALIKADKDFDLLVMPGAGHGILGTPYAKRKMLAFFEKNLRPEATE